jgi:hypothetical protein
VAPDRRNDPHACGVVRNCCCDPSALSGAVAEVSAGHRQIPPLPARAEQWRYRTAPRIGGDADYPRGGADRAHRIAHEGVKTGIARRQLVRLSTSWQADFFTRCLGFALMKSCTGRDDRRMRRLIRGFVTKIPFLGRYRLLRASDIARLQGHNRLLTEAATESARKLQEHNRLLTEAATESARSHATHFRPMPARHPLRPVVAWRGHDDGNSRILPSLASRRSPAAQEPSASCVPRGQEDYCVACQTLAHGDRTHRNCRARRARREKGASSGMRTSADASVHAHGPSLITTHASVIDLVLSMEKVSVRSTLA